MTLQEHRARLERVVKLIEKQKYIYDNYRIMKYPKARFKDVKVSFKQKEYVLSDIYHDVIEMVKYNSMCEHMIKRKIALENTLFKCLDDYILAGGSSKYLFRLKYIKKLKGL